ncbi:MAG: hypothetical protein K0U98_15430 [Deltaproteobacteria bacterium]|nr:hypothetical protein [Deltaproteobacteria bacterium]
MKPTNITGFTTALRNFAPTPYRQVSVQPHRGPWGDRELQAHLLSREAYRATRFVILEGKAPLGEALGVPRQVAVLEVKRAREEPLFSPIVEVRLLAGPKNCRWVDDETVDTASPSALAARAKVEGVDSEETLVVRGRDGHVNFIHRPDPLPIEIFDVVPPSPPKLAWMAQQVVDYVDLPAVELSVETLDLRQLVSAAGVEGPLLIPCRASGLSFEAETHYLDERPERRPWTLVGCERSRQIHHHMYGDEPSCIETCPLQRAPVTGERQLIKCCLLQDQVEVKGNRAVVPWGTTRKHLEIAFEGLVGDV